MSPGLNSKVMIPSEQLGMDHPELHDALQWLRCAVTVAENTLLTELAPKVREERRLALDRKRVLLRDLQQLNDRLLALPASTVDANVKALHAAPAT